MESPSLVCPPRTSAQQSYAGTVHEGHGQGLSSLRSVLCFNMWVVVKIMVLLDPHYDTAPNI